MDNWSNKRCLCTLLTLVGACMHQRILFIIEEDYIPPYTENIMAAWYSVYLFRLSLRLMFHLPSAFIAIPCVLYTGRVFIAEGYTFLGWAWFYYGCALSAFAVVVWTITVVMCLGYMLGCWNEDDIELF